jgi:hypothetical protein
MLRKKNATAEIVLLENNVNSIKLKINGLDYFFDDEPQIQEFRNGLGDKCIKKIFKYGG